MKAISYQNEDKDDLLALEGKKKHKHRHSKEVFLKKKKEKETQLSYGNSSISKFKF